VSYRCRSDDILGEPVTVADGGDRGLDFTWVNKAGTRWVLELKNSTGPRKSQRWNTVQRWVEKTATEVIPELSDDQLSALWKEIAAVLEAEAAPAPADKGANREGPDGPHRDRKPEVAPSDPKTKAPDAPAAEPGTAVQMPGPDRLTAPFWTRFPQIAAEMQKWPRTDKLAFLTLLVTVIIFVLQQQSDNPTRTQITQIINNFPAIIINDPPPMETDQADLECPADLGAAPHPPKGVGPGDGRG
jgi:hypothetical protein